MRYMVKEPVVDAFKMTRDRHLNRDGWPRWLHNASNKPTGVPGSLFTDFHSSQMWIIRKYGERRMVHYNYYIVRDGHGNLEVWSPYSFLDNFILAREVT